MENRIIINGKESSGEKLEWLFQQDLPLLLSYLSLHIIEDVYRNGEENGLNAPLTKEDAKALFVLCCFLQGLQGLKQTS